MRKGSFVFIAVLLLALMLPLFVKPSYATTVTLAVNSYDLTYNQWNKYGVSPYLHDDDNAGNYIAKQASAQKDGYYGFSDLPSEITSFSSVTLKIKTWNRPYVYLWNGASWVQVFTYTDQSGWTYSEVDVSSQLDTVAKVNGAKIYVETFGSTYNYWVTYACLVVTYVSNTPPQYSNIAYSTNEWGKQCTFSSYWTDNSGLSGFTFATNNTGSWVNDTFASLSGTQAWANVTKTLNSTLGMVVGFQWFANDTDNAWNQTSIYTLTISDLYAPTYVDTHANEYGSGKLVFTVSWSDDYALNQYRFGWNASGGWFWHAWQSFGGSPQTATVTVEKYAPKGVENVTWKMQASDLQGNIGETPPQNLSLTVAYDIPLGSYMLLGMGLLGFGMFMFSPLYAIKKIKDHEVFEGLTWGFLMFIIGVALIIAWLWSVS
jgi:hypothetical protein